MKLIVDHAGIADIRRLYEYYPLSGVTTNPSILAKAKRPPMEVLKEIRQLISEETGVPENNIQVSATHTHSGPTIGGTLPLTVAWKPTYVNALVTSAKNAIADLAPATLYGAKVQTEGMAFVRHYKMEDGSYAGSNFGDFSKKIVDHATVADACAELGESFIIHRCMPLVFGQIGH